MTFEFKFQCGLYEFKFQMVSGYSTLVQFQSGTRKFVLYTIRPLNCLISIKTVEIREIAMSLMSTWTLQWTKFDKPISTRLSGRSDRVARSLRYFFSLPLRRNSGESKDALWRYRSARQTGVARRGILAEIPRRELTNPDLWRHRVLEPLEYYFFSLKLLNYEMQHKFFTLFTNYFCY